MTTTSSGSSTNIEWKSTADEGAHDTNVLLDVLLPREPWAAESKAVWDAADTGRFDGYISAISLPNLFYVARKVIGLDKARECVALLLDAFEIIPIDRQTLEAALALPKSDFEDNIQSTSALAAGIDLIVTRDVGGFSQDVCPAVAPAELLARLAASQP